MGKLAVFLCLGILLCYTLGECSEMTKRARPCPCEEHKNAFTPHTTWKRHTGEIARGKRHRWVPVPEGQAEEKQEQAGADEDHKAAECIEPEEPKEDPTAKVYATELTELVARGVINVTGAEAVLKVQHSNYQEHLQGDVQIPKSWYRARKLATEGREIKWFARDFCPKCDKLFPVDKEEATCTRCNEITRYDSEGKSIRQAQYMDISDKQANEM